MAVPKLERLLNLVAALLHTQVPLTAAMLQQRVGGYSDDAVAFHRQFSRDKEALREMGVPIRVEIVPDIDPPIDGYLIDPDEYYLPDPHLDVEELAALHLATRLVRVGGDAETGSLLKLGGMVGADETRAPLANVPADPNLGRLYDAIHRQRTVTFSYHDRERRLVPRALGFQTGHWYVTGWDLEAEDQRIYRLDRLEGDVGDDGAAPDVPGSAMSIATMQPWQVGGSDQVTAKLRIAPAAVAAIAAQIGDERVEVVGPDGVGEAMLDVQNIEGFRTWLLGFGPAVQVTEPEALRRGVVGWLERIAGDRP